ncbi:MAG: enoyl-CoA hydratase-related protein, partial [Pseudohongiellaceae bacterium]
MIYQGKGIRVEKLPSGIARLVFDLTGSTVNKFDQATLSELRAAIKAVGSTDVTGLIFSSAKAGFIVGADIMEFTALFKAPTATLIEWLRDVNQIFNSIEDLPFPTVCAINGVALGGGFELAVSADYRVASQSAMLGFPEVKLGICPGFGGTVRLPRLIGADNANLWISSGNQMNASQALAEGAIDAIVDEDQLTAAAERMIAQCNAGKLDYQRVRRQKTSPLMLNGTELMVAFETAKALVSAKAGPHYPAPVAAVKAMQEAATTDRAGALEIEHRTFAALAMTPVAANLVQLFLNEQFLNGRARKMQAQARPIKTAAVLGAGIMGGGIAYQSALKGIPIVMKDIAQEGLDLGIREATKQLG